MAEISFEKALEKLEKTVEDIEAGDLSLDNSLKKYEEGVKLARMCQKKLDKAKEKIEVLISEDSGSFKTKAFEGKEE